MNASTAQPNFIQVPTVDAESYCRLCFSTESIDVLFPIGRYPRDNVLDLIRQTVGIDITMEDDFPCAVCRDCQRTLSGFASFRERCQKNHDAVRLLRSNHNPVRKLPSTVTKTPELISLLSRGSKCAKRGSAAGLEQFYGGMPSGRIETPIGTMSLEEPMVFCNVCSVGFETPEELSLHAVEQHNSCERDDKHYKCQLCTRSYSSLGALNKHTKTHGEITAARKRKAADRRPETETGPIPDVQVPVPNYDEPQPTPFMQHMCPLCLTVFDNEELMQKHMDEAHEPGELMHQMFSDESSAIHSMDCSASVSVIEPIVQLDTEKAHQPPVGSTGDANFRCLLCDASFRFLRKLKGHHDKCHAPQKFLIQCEKCGQLLAKYQLRKHYNPLLGCGVKVLPFSCSQCHKRFKRERGMKQHMVKFHRNVTPSCQVVLERLPEDNLRQLISDYEHLKELKRRKKKIFVMPIQVKQEVNEIAS